MPESCLDIQNAIASGAKLSMRDYFHHFIIVVQIARQTI